MPQVERKCEHCGKVFFPLLAQVKRGRGRFCSRSCSSKAQEHKSGPEHHLWKGGATLDSVSGYRFVRVGKGKQQVEHRVVMEAYLGRKLLPTEVVHHKNENRSDNRIENLQVMTLGEHTRHHRIGRRKPPLSCPACGGLSRRWVHGVCTKCYQRTYEKTRVRNRRSR